MLTNFPACYKLTRQNEGGNSDDPADRGGKTSRGITKAAYDKYRLAVGLPKRDVYLMTEDEALDIYRTGYWDPIGGNSLPIGVDYAGYDWCVNSGQKPVIPVLKSTGNMTPAARVKAICAKRTSFVNAIKDFAKFRKGVLARVARVEVDGVKMTLPAAAPTLMKANASVASQKADSAATKAKSVAIPTSVGAGGGASGIATTPTLGWEAWIGFGVMITALVLIVIYFIYEHQKHSARADAYAAA